MADNEKILNTKLNVETSEAEKQIARLTKQFDELEKKLNEKITLKDNLLEQLEANDRAVVSLTAQLEQLKKAAESFRRANSSWGADGTEIWSSEANRVAYQEQIADFERFENLLASTDAEQRELAAEVERTANEISVMTADMDTLTTQIGDLEAQAAAVNDVTYETADAAEQTASATEEIAKNTEETKKNVEESSTGSRDLTNNANGIAEAFEKVGNRLARMVRNIFFFNLIGKALREVLSYISQAMAQNQQWVNAVRELRGAFQTLAQPLLNAVLPILVTVLQVLTAIVSHIASVLALFFGTTLQDSANSAKQISAGMGGAAKSAEKMKKSLAGFDQLNVLQDNDTSSGGGGAKGGIKGSTFNFADGIKSKILELEAIALGAMLALGLLLLFFGGPAQWPLALGLIAAGALGLAGLVNSSDITPELRAKILEVTEIASLAALALGVILLFFGGAGLLGKAIGLIAVGAAGLAAVYATNGGSTLIPKISADLAAIMLICSAALLALGIILLFLGGPGAAGLAVGLILAGAAGMGVASQTGWFAQWKQSLKGKLEEIKQTVVDAWHKLVAKVKEINKKYLQPANLFDGLAKGFKSVVEKLKQWWENWTRGLKQEWENVTANIKEAWDAVKTFVQNKAEALKTSLVNKWNSIWTKVNDVWSKIKSGASEVGNKVKSYIEPKVESVKEAFNKVIGTFTNLKDKGETVFTAIKQAMSGDFIGAIKTLQDGFTTAASDVAAIGSETDEVGDKLNDVFGKKYTLEIETNEVHNIATNITEAYAPGGKYKVSAMASGGVIPPNREFLTLLGDNKTEAEVVSPISTMQQAMVQALEQSGYSGGNQTIQVNVDGRRLFDVMVNQNNSAVKRTGTSPLLV